MNYLSVCSGIEAATVAWHPLGWKPVAFSEIERFPSEVLKHHYPDVPNVFQQMAVRRLTPVECERLQGFTDNYTDIKPKGKATPDGPRYKALGNSMAVPVMAWIGKRIQEVESIKCKPNK